MTLKKVVTSLPHLLALAIIVFNALLAAHAFTLPPHVVDVINAALVGSGLSSLKVQV